MRAVVALRTPYAPRAQLRAVARAWCWRSTERVYKNAQCERLTVFMIRAEVTGNREAEKSLRLKLLKTKTNTKWQIPAKPSRNVVSEGLGEYLWKYYLWGNRTGAPGCNSWHVLILMSLPRTRTE